jgi:hypothetical protein
MKVKPLFALVLSLATIGLSLPALAGEGGNWNSQDSGHTAQSSEHQDKKSPQYYGNYYPYKIGNYYIYVGSKGDYFDRYGKYYAAEEHPEYSQYYNSQYNFEQYGNYYDEYGKYHEAKKGSKKWYR